MLHQRSTLCRLGRIQHDPELFSALAEALRVPPYFGGNWDGLWDVIRDLSWIEAETIVLVHAELPRVPDSVLSLYLRILAEAVEDVRSNGHFELQVVFPAALRAEVIAAIDLLDNP